MGGIYGKFLLIKVKPYYFQEPAHTCRHCGKLFSSARGMREHAVVHTGERNHVCGGCGKTYSHRSGLWKHTSKTGCGADLSNV